MTLKSMLEVTKIIRNCTIRQTAYKFLLLYYCNHDHVLYCFRDTGCKLRFFIPFYTTTLFGKMVALLLHCFSITKPHPWISRLCLSREILQKNCCLLTSHAHYRQMDRQWSQ